jgi:hypothetical protein
MYRGLILLSVILALLYFHLPFPRPSESTFKFIYDTWAAEWKREDVVVLREFVAKNQVDALKSRQRVNSVPFAVLVKESVGESAKAGGNIGEWSASQLDERFGKEFRLNMFGARTGDISDVIPTSDNRWAFYLLGSKKKRSVNFLPAAQMRGTIQERYASFQESTRGTAWLIGRPQLDQQRVIDWYADVAGSIKQH